MNENEIESVGTPEPANPHRIIFKKWVDPFRVAMNEHKERGWSDSYKYLDNPGQVGAYQGPMLAGPIGFIPINEMNCPSKNFNLWVGHTSFELDQPTLNRMKVVPGVEVLKVWTRYRFWLGVGAAFEENEVKKAVALASKPPVEKTKLEKTVEKIVNEDASLEVLKKTVAGKFQHWAIFVMENGKLDVAGGDDREKVEAKIEERSGHYKRVVTSWDKG